MNNCRLIYDRYFTAKKGCEYNGNKILGVSVELLFAFGDEAGNEIFYNNGDECIAQEKVVCRIDKNSGIKLETQKVIGENITVLSVSPVKYLLDCYVGKANSFIKNCPEAFKDAPVSKYLEITKEEFVSFIQNNWSAFDTVENMKAPCTSLRYVNANANSSLN